jgi:hypothetical protein
MDPVLTVLSNISFAPVLGLVLSLGCAMMAIAFAGYSIKYGAAMSGAMSDSFMRTRYGYNHVDDEYQLREDDDEPQKRDPPRVEEDEDEDEEEDD